MSASTHRSGPGRWRRTALGATVLLVAVAAICLGALAAAAEAAGTYVDLGGHGTYRSDRYGLATNSTDWRSQLFGWAGSVRLEVAAAGGKPIFVGVAAPEAIARYLAGAGYTTVAERGGVVVRTEHEGGPLSPAASIDWTAQAEGGGTQTLRWQATSDRQVVLATNADGSRPVRVRVVSSAVTLERMPWWAPAGLVALGILLLPVGGVTLRRARG